MQFRGMIQGHEILILVDSGSTHSFLSFVVASRLSGVQPMAKPVSVKIADGAAVVCDSKLPAIEWSVQGYRFHSNLKVLTLGLYDLILGMNWLEAFSPMKINWCQKWMSITYGSQEVLLHNSHHLMPECSVVQLFHIVEDVSSQSEPVMPPEVHAVVDQFKHLFAKPSSLPPRRACDHRIPLI